MQDNFGRNIDYARISLTDRCNYRCVYCMPECGVEKKTHNDILSLEDTFKIICGLKDLGIKKFRFTGGEPLVRKGAVDLIEKTAALEGVKTALTTNGVFVPICAQKLSEIGLQGLNISIDTLDKEKYKIISGGGNLEDALKGLESAINAGIENIKINAVLMKGVNDDDIEKFAKFGKEKGARVRFIELMPFSNGNSFEKYGISADEVINRYNLKKVDIEEYTKNTEYYAFDDGKIVGFIRPISHKFCSECNRIRLTADGKLLLCLHRNIEVDLRDCLDDYDALKDRIKEAILNKPEGHNLDAGNLQSRSMNAIGG
ncbi:MAG: GTP 3',8-cyclase MoaA [Clostridia bacterium]|nr:GTP 3',8-cyclase MoaA [Clostridia bacterium]